MDEAKISTILRLFIVGTVESSSSNEILRELFEHEWEENPIENLEVYISSEGGFLNDCFAIIDVINRFKFLYKFQVTTFGIGEISSAGLFLFMLGDRRILFPSCRVFVHEHISIGGTDQTYSERIKEDKGEEKAVYLNYLKYTAKQLNLTTTRAKTLLKKKKWLTDKEIKTFNIATEDRLKNE